LCAIAAACGSGRPAATWSPVAQDRAGDIRYVFAGSDVTCDPEHGFDEALAVGIWDSTLPALAAALGTRPDVVTTKTDLFKALRRDDPHPIFLYYAGHGPVGPPKGKSELCFRDGNVPIDSVLASISPRARYLVMVADACFSAHVDTRLSPVPAAVISADIRFVSPPPGVKSTVLGLAVPRALNRGDANGDGVVDDGELFDALPREIKQRPVHGVPIPFLRRQASTALPILHGVRERRGPNAASASAAIQNPEFSTLISRDKALLSNLADWHDTPNVLWGVDPTDANSVSPVLNSPVVHGSAKDLKTLARTLGATQLFALRKADQGLQLWFLRDETMMATFPPAELGDVVNRVNNGNWATENGGRIWHGGWVPKVVVTVDGTHRDGNTLTAIPCEDHIGQCFR
jgi:hypothetical protein